MLKLTKRAAEQIRRSAEESSMEDHPLRIAAHREADQSIKYAFGFDTTREGDMLISAEGGVDVVIDENSKALLGGATMDYVELEAGEFHFIFLNPNDPHYVPPKEDEVTQ